MPRIRIRSLFAGLFALLLVSLLTWANWQEPNLHDYVPSASISLLHVGGLSDPARAASLERRIAVLDGVTDCNLNSQTQVAVVTHYPDQISLADIRRSLSNNGAYVVTEQAFVPAAAATGPQCPVPAGYLVALEKLRFALNFRRFFIQV